MPDLCCPNHQQFQFQPASDFKSNPLVIWTCSDLNHCNFSWDFDANDRQIYRRFDCAFALCSAIWKREILQRCEIPAIAFLPTHQVPLIDSIDAQLWLTMRSNIGSQRGEMHFTTLSDPLHKGYWLFRCAGNHYLWGRGGQLPRLRVCKRNSLRFWLHFSGVCMANDVLYRHCAVATLLGLQAPIGYVDGPIDTIHKKGTYQCPICHGISDANAACRIAGSPMPVFLQVGRHPRSTKIKHSKCRDRENT